MERLQMELAEIKIRRNQQEAEIANIENLALRQRFQHILDEMLSEQLKKEQQVCNVHIYSTILRIFKLI